jgi:hypothetical protein
MAASAQGQEFDSAVVAKLLGHDGAEVEDALEILDRIHAFVRLIGERELPDSTLTLHYAFVHSLYQNALYSAVTATRSTSWSAAVGQMLLDCYGNRDGKIAAELAFLFEAARNFSRASEYFIVAGKNAAAVSANRKRSLSSGAPSPTLRNCENHFVTRTFTTLPCSWDKYTRRSPL